MVLLLAWAMVHLTGTSTVPFEFTCRMVMVNVDLGSLEIGGVPCKLFSAKVPKLVPLAEIADEACGV